MHKIHNPFINLWAFPCGFLCQATCCRHCSTKNPINSPGVWVACPQAVTLNHSSVTDILNKTEITGNMCGVQWKQSNRCYMVRISGAALQLHMLCSADTLTWHIQAETNSHHFADDIFKCIFFSEDVWISLRISLKFDPKARINNIPALVQIMAWHRPGD